MLGTSFGCPTAFLNMASPTLRAPLDLITPPETLEWLPGASLDMSSLVAWTPMGTLFIRVWSFCQVSTL